MIAALAALAGLALLVAGVLRALRSGRIALAQDADVLLRIEIRPRQEHPVLTLEHRGTALFGPVPARWNARPAAAMACGNPSRDPAQPGGDVPSGLYRVVEGADLSGAAAPIRVSFSPTVLILQPEQGGRPVLLHGARGLGVGTGNIIILQRALEALLRQLGDPRGLRVEVVRRSIRRGGWGATGQAVAARGR